jgi:hypothetical protein
MVQSSSSGNKTNAEWVQVTMPNGEMDRLLTGDSPPPPASSFHPDDGHNVYDPPVEATVVSEESQIPTAQVEPQKARVAASGTAGCILGCLIGGPICAILGGFSSAYAAKNKVGAVGDCARAMGDVALVAKAKALEVEEKHHVVDNTKQVAAGAWENAKEMDREYNICEKTKDAIVYTGKATVNFTVKHRLLERGVQGMGRGMEFAADNLSANSSPSAANEQQGTSCRRGPVASIPAAVVNAEITEEISGKQY